MFVIPFNDFSILNEKYNRNTYHWLPNASQHILTLSQYRGSPTANHWSGESLSLMFSLDLLGLCSGFRLGFLTKSRELRGRLDIQDIPLPQLILDQTSSLQH